VNWLDRWRMRRAARQFATRLPGYMSRSWGGADDYTEAQVAKALQHFRLGGEFTALAYAAFMTEADYVAMAARLPRVLPYDLARIEFERARPWIGGAWNADERFGSIDAGDVADVGGGAGHSGH
jgi:hypothetical protein